MAPDLIDDDLQAATVRLGHHGVEIGKRAEARIDAAVIAHVITEILHRRRKERRDPHAVHTQLRHMGEFRRDATQVADAVTVRIIEAARINLIDDRAAPPVFTHPAILCIHTHDAGRPVKDSSTRWSLGKCCLLTLVGMEG